jgi:hypothetical protein
VKIKRYYFLACTTICLLVLITYLSLNNLRVLGICFLASLNIFLSCVYLLVSLNILLVLIICML